MSLQPRDAGDVGLLLRQDERDAHPAATRAPRAADAVRVDVSFLGRVEVDHVRDVREVEPARRHVRRDERRHRAGAEALEGALASALGHVPVEGRRADAAVAELPGEPVGAALRPDEHERKAALGVEYLEREKPLRAGEPYKLRFRLTDTATGKPADGLKDVRVLVFLAPGIWQQRELAAHAGGGVYEVSFTPPQAGVYYIYFRAPSLGVQFNQMPFLALRATSAEAGPPPKAAQQ